MTAPGQGEHTRDLARRNVRRRGGLDRQGAKIKEFLKNQRNVPVGL